GRGGVGGEAAVVGGAAAGPAAPARGPPATATPARNLRRLTSGRECCRLIKFLPCMRGASWPTRLNRAYWLILSARQRAEKSFCPVHGNVHTRGPFPCREGLCCTAYWASRSCCLRPDHAAAERSSSSLR